jgi:hypothetical protein
LSEQFLGVPPCLELFRAFYSCRFKGKKKKMEEEEEEERKRKRRSHRWRRRKGGGAGDSSCASPAPPPPRSTAAHPSNLPPWRTFPLPNLISLMLEA